ncbi:hypothetical protein V1512DRAFT_256507 [Lipomyces arxii]|uniref:uncharacterized protein n=1 Tax=Lipomyces arxii TaxID=56418 RepID=UPI0034CE3FFF
MPRKRPQSAYFSVMAGGLGTSEFMTPLPTPEPSPQRADGLQRASSITASGQQQHQQNRRQGRHGYSQSLSPASSSIMSTPSPTRPTFLTRPSSIASSGSTTSTNSSSGGTRNFNNSRVLESPTRMPKEERSRRRVSQPVVVNPYYNTKRMSRDGIYATIAGSGVSMNRKSSTEVAPIQYPAVGMFTVQSILSSAGCPMPKLYETSFEFVEVCDAYFHAPGHLSPESVLGGRVVRG